MQNYEITRFLVSLPIGNVLSNRWGINPGDLQGLEKMHRKQKKTLFGEYFDMKSAIVPDESFGLIAKSPYIYSVYTMLFDVAQRKLPTEVALRDTKFLNRTYYQDGSLLGEYMKVVEPEEQNIIYTLLHAYDVLGYDVEMLPSTESKRDTSRNFSNITRLIEMRKEK